MSSQRKNSIIQNQTNFSRKNFSKKSTIKRGK